MNGLIGNKDSAKFIFLAIDEESLIPSKSEMTELFAKHEMTVYKAWGYFKESFDAIQGYMQIRRDGIAAYRRWTAVKPCISHAIRLSDQCPSNSFFNLKYQHICVGTYRLSHELFDELDALLKETESLNNIVAQAYSFKKVIADGQEFTRSSNLIDPSMSNPCEASIAKLLDDYGNSAAIQLSNKFDDWHERAIWL